MTPRGAPCRLEMSLALIEAAFEQGLLECELVTYERSSSVEDSDLPREWLGCDSKERMRQSMRIAQGSSGRLATWLYCALLVLVGVLLNAVLGSVLKG